MVPPDGQWLTFTNAEGEQDDLWVVRVDGADARRVYDCEAPCNYVDDPAWSPDGRSIAVCKASEDENLPFSLIGVDVETGAETLLFTPSGTDFCAGPRWSADGTKIVLELVAHSSSSVDDDITGVQLRILDLAQNPPAATALTNRIWFAATADWSYATDVIVYSAPWTAAQPRTTSTRSLPNGGDPTRLTFLADDGGSAYEPSWDLTGETVVFVNDNGALMRIDVDSGHFPPAFDSTIFANYLRVRPRP